MIRNVLVLFALASLAGCMASGSVKPPDGGQPPPGADGAVTLPGEDGTQLPPDSEVVPSPDVSPDVVLPPLPDSGLPIVKPDTGTPPPQQDAGTTPPTTKLSNKVAAVQYAAGQQSQVKPACGSDAMPDVCALKELVLKAVSKGASYVVLPEYATGQDYYEPTPVKGENPATDSAWPADMIIKIFSSQAKQQGIYLIFNLLTYKTTSATCLVDSDCSGNGVCSQSGSCANLYNTTIACDDTGKVVGVHYKFNLFGGETSSLTAGTSVSVFDTPNLGKMGMLISDDISGSTSLNNELGSKADVVAVSSYWTVSNPVNTYYKSYLGKYSYYSVIANTTDSPGYGGGVFKGAPWQAVPTSIGNNPEVAAKPSVVVAPVKVTP